MVGRSRCCWYDVVGAWWKPRRAERVLRNCSWTQSTAYSLAQASDRIRSAGRSSCENMRLLTYLHVCVYHVGAHRVLACQSFSGQAPSPRLRGFLRQHHLIPSSPSCYGADILFCSNLLKCHGTGKPNNTWLNHFLGSPLPRRY